jgi:hypothetical protein
MKARGNICCWLRQLMRHGVLFSRTRRRVLAIRSDAERRIRSAPSMLKLLPARCYVSLFFFNEFKAQSWHAPKRRMIVR